MTQEVLIVRASEAPEVRDGNPAGYYYDLPNRSEGPFQTQIDMCAHAQERLPRPWRWFIPGYDNAQKEALS